MTMPTSRFHILAPGLAIPGDWHPGRVPNNIEVGQNTVIDSSFSFLHYEATGPLGLRVGSNVTLWRTALSVGPGAVIEIGNYCYLANASLACTERITLGSYVLVANGVTIVDSDFHPIDVDARIMDTIALSPTGDRGKRPRIEARPVVIEDCVRIGFNATILKGVNVGTGAVIAPGAVVSRDVAPGRWVAGSPAREIPPGEGS